MCILSEARVKRFLEVIKEKQIFNILITQIDPDAIGAAACMAEILRRRAVSDVEIRIYYCGKVSNRQNKAIITIYGLGSSMSHVEDLASRHLDNVILLDSHSSADTRFPDGLTINPIVVIDHHKPASSVQENGDNFLWVENVGATCTMIVELARGLEFDFSGEIGKGLSCLLALGIHNDTKSMISAGSRDRDAHAFLVEYFDPADYNRIVNYPLPESYYANYGKAVSGYKRKDQTLVTGLGSIPISQADDVSLIADNLIRMEGVTLVVVWAIDESKRVRLSLRCSDPSLDLLEFITEKFGVDSGGVKDSAGGTASGGAIIKLDFGSLALPADPKFQANVVQLVADSIAHKVFTE